MAGREGDRNIETPSSKGHPLLVAPRSAGDTEPDRELAAVQEEEGKFL